MMLGVNQISKPFDEKIISLTDYFLYFNSLTAVTYNSEPKIFIQELVNDAIKTLSDKSLTLEEKNIVIEKIVIENVDVKGLGFYTLGQIRKDLDENTLNTYQDLFQDYFLKSLFSRLNDYSSQKFEVLEADKKCKLHNCSIKSCRNY